MGHGHDENTGHGKEFWDAHWSTGDRGSGSMATNPPNPYVDRELGDLPPARALDAGCGAGAEAIRLAELGWQVTAADVAEEALRHARSRAEAAGVLDRVEVVQADLGTWTPDAAYDLVMTHYAHPDMPQLEFYDRVATWVAPGGTLLVVGHRHDPVTAAAVADRLTGWDVVTADEPERRLGHRTLQDVVVRARRRD